MALVGPHIAVYGGPGAGHLSQRDLQRSLRRALRPDIQVRIISEEEILEGSWTLSCRMLAVPGGADLPYCKSLNGKGNWLIKEFVEAGGSYLGICAGAYYASAVCEFEAGTRMEVVGERELAFFPGVARGCVYKGFDYRGLDGAGVVPLRFRSSDDGNWTECSDFVNGGPLFALPGHTPPEPEHWSTVEARFPGVKVLATYPERGDAPAALRCGVGRGVAVLCGTHPETNPDALVEEYRDERAEALASELAEAAPVRQRWWREILGHCLPSEW
eukprot:CAMPEP_0177765714 /NCGR_PEP_ID=MMETSP0491_2-20121128/8137_1 /TAXON_ID=63592 /ORGANISM="Tetraselmis chuii, Strain PLY429" /LENGTH=272 /DNA_ID=CAMNT_0019282077 /DNA_START=221 /DNA_END=1036 /DNA_ORIENTATION=+